MNKHSKKATGTVAVVGLDLGNRQSHGCSLNEHGEVLERFQVATTKAALTDYFAAWPATRLVLEVGTHSPWVSRLLQSLGHEVIVANAWRVKAIHQALHKNDKRDAELLARLGRADVQLLAPIKHRGEATQVARVLLSSRDLLVSARTDLINHVRGSVKSLGGLLPKCAAEAFVAKARPHLPPALCPALEPLLETISRLNVQIRQYDKELERLAQEQYPETAHLRQVKGVGPLTALAFVLTVEDPGRFPTSRDVGPYLGLVPKDYTSGESQPQLHITRAGDDYLRKLLVNAAQYILGPFGPDNELRRFGEALCARGGKNAKKRAVIAVARKLAVLLHRLWVSGATYEPFYYQQRQSARRAGGSAPK